MNTSAFISRTIALSAVLCLSLQIGYASTYIVDRDHSSASDSNAGTLEAPWRTIQQAAGTALSGDTVYIRSGVYNEHVRFEQSGNASAPIVFSAYPGEQPILDGTGVTESQNGIIIIQSHLVVNGLEIRNWNDNGMWIEGARFVEIIDCDIHDVANGIGISEGSHDITLTRVTAYRYDLYGFDTTPNGSDCYNITFNDCVSHTGRDSNQNVDGFAIGHGTQHHFTFNRCRTYNVFDGFDVGENAGDGSEHVLLNRCIAYDCWNDGYKITGGARVVNCIGYNNSNANVAVYWADHGGNTVLQNCTFYGSGTFNVWMENSQDALQMYNCILAAGSNIGLGFEQRNASTYLGDNNLFHQHSGERAVVVGYEDEFTIAEIQDGSWTTFSGQDGHSLTSTSPTEVFVSPTNRDFHLAENSVAIDRGRSTNAPAEDYDGSPRPIGNEYDIGAYEFQGSTDVHREYAPQPSRSVLRGNSPNPFRRVTMIHVNVPPGVRYATLGIYDLLGRTVIMLAEGSLSPSSTLIQWDGQDAAGHAVPPGVYFCRYTSRDKTECQSLVLAR